jgi:glycosyltransferase involved in cell wall biosynthesis
LSPRRTSAVHIGLNLVYMVPGATGGMEIYARELIPALRAAAPAVRLTVFVNREAAAGGAGALPWDGSVDLRVVPVHAASRVQWVIGEQLPLPRMAAACGVQVLHSLASTAPVWGRFRRVVTVHDLIFAHYPQAHGRVRALGMRALVPLAVRGSDRVIAISAATRRDIERLLATPSEKIDVVPQGLGAVVEPSAAGVDRMRARLGAAARRVLLSASAKRPHKNLPSLLGALARVPATRRPLLVLPGYPTPHERELRTRAAQLRLDADVRFLGWVEQEELEALWRLADAFIFPSLYEGFGLPVLEAMARGVPVACSNASSLPEVAGDAALLFDPRSEPQIASAIERLLADGELVERLRAAGRERARMFTWQRTAQLTLASYARALGLNEPPPSWTQPDAGDTPSV